MRTALAKSTSFLDRGRSALRDRSWAIAYEELAAADQEAPLSPHDLASLGQVANLIGREDECFDLLRRAHHGFLTSGETRGAVRCAFWLGFMAMLNGETAQASGWLARARRLLDECGQECVEEGYLLLPVGFRSVHGGDAAVAYKSFQEATNIGEHFGDPDLATLGRQGQGRALIRLGEINRGVTLLDEAMVAVTAGEVSPLVAGGVYCSVIEACGEIFDLRRAREWTAALDQWCAAQPDIVPYRGHCQVRRAEILQLQGVWDDAIAAAQQACETLLSPKIQRAAGSAFHCLGDLHRLRGEFAEAEAAYRKANELSPTPRPGLALLLLSQGKVDLAVAAIRSTSKAALQPGPRSQVLEAYVEIALAAGDIPAAREAAHELTQIAGRLNAPVVQAMSDRAMGYVLLAEHDYPGALAALRASLNAWREVDSAYEAARCRSLIGLVYRAQGDPVSADMEFAAARSVFQQLGALPDLACVDAGARTMHSPPDSPLTARETEVLVLVASGKTNRAISERLFISEKTVARHISNIFDKLNVSSRAAATAYAYQKKLISPST